MMKVIYLALFYLCFLHLQLNAQSSFGVKGGLNAAWLGVESETMKFGFHAGAYGCLDLGTAAVLQAELIYSQKGSTLNELLLYDITFSLRYDYLSLPVMIGLKLGDNVVLQLGSEMSYLLNAKTKLNEQVTKGKGVLPDFDIGLVSGFQIMITERIELQLRYVHGLSKINGFYFTDINGNPIGSFESGKNRVLQAGISYRLSKSTMGTE